MKKRQFGKGRPVVAAEHNTSQNYVVGNLQEIVQDLGLYGLISGAVCTTANEGFFVNISTTIARDYVGDRISILSTQKVSAQPTVPLLLTQEVVVCLYAKHIYNAQEQDIDEDGNVYYKNWLDNYEILKIQGTVSTIGHAISPDVPVDGLLLCDVTIDGTMVVIENSDIDVSRQVWFADNVGSDLTLTGNLEVFGSTILRTGLSLVNSALTDVKDPTSDSEVGDRGYNDARYTLKAGDTMTGKLNLPSLKVTGTTSTGNIYGTGTATINGRITGNDGYIVSGNSKVYGELQTTGKFITDTEIFSDGRVVARSFFVEWYQNKDYQAGVIVTNSNKFYQALDLHHSTSTGTFTSDIAHWKLVGGKGGSAFDVTLVNHGFSVGDVLRYTTTVPGNFALAIADSYDHLAHFIVSEVQDLNNFTIMSSGYIEGLSGLVPNQWYYLSAITAGTLTSISPLISQKMLFATTTSTGYVYPYDVNVGAQVYVDSFVATTGQTDFTLTQSPSGKDWIILSIDGAVQHESAFDILFDELTLTSGCVGGEDVRVQYIVSIASASEGNISVNDYIATEGQTTFALSIQPVGKNYLNVSVNGYTQNNDSFSLDGSGNLIFSEGLREDDKVRIQHFYSVKVHPEYYNIIKFQQTITETQTIESGNNGLSVGPITVASGTTITVPSGTTWAIV